MFIASDRVIVKLWGPEAVSFLHSIVPADIEALAVGNALSTALLSPQGKFLADFFVMRSDMETLWLDVHEKFRETVMQKLKMYKLRRDVTIEDASQEMCSIVEIGADDLPPAAAMIYADPRHTALGRRAMCARVEAFSVPTMTEDMSIRYHRHRVELGIADGAYDLVPEKSIILEYGYDTWGAIAWNKGCYVGQELMSRTKFTGVVRKQLYTVRAPEGQQLPPLGAEVKMAGQSVGEMRSSVGDVGLALLRSDLIPKDVKMVVDIHNSNQSSPCD